MRRAKKKKKTGDCDRESDDQKIKKKRKKRKRRKTRGRKNPSGWKGSFYSYNFHGAINIKLDTRIFIRIGNEGVELNAVYSSGRDRYGKRYRSNVRLPIRIESHIRMEHCASGGQCRLFTPNRTRQSRNLSRHLCPPSRTSNFNGVFLRASRLSLSLVYLFSACLSAYLGMFAHFPAVLLP